MVIKVGDRVPEATLQVMGASGPEPKTSKELFSGRRVAVFAVPGAFTPTCSSRHLPGFLKHADAIKAKGVNDIVCVAVNDVFVMDAWGRSQGAGSKVMMAADGGGAFTEAMGLAIDTASFGGIRSMRYSMLVDDGVVTVLNLEEGGEFKQSSAETMLEQL